MKTSAGSGLVPDGNGGQPTITDVGVGAEDLAAAVEMQRGLSKMVDLRGLTKYVCVVEHLLIDNVASPIPHKLAVQRPRRTFGQ